MQMEIGCGSTRARPPDGRERGALAPQSSARTRPDPKQVILQRVRDAERDAIYSDFIDKEGKIVRGVVHRIEKRNVMVELGKAEGVITEREQIPGERYNPGDRVRAYVLEVKKTAKGPQILLSRTHPGFLARLFEAEIPEIAEGIVQVRAAAREAGERAKVAVASTKRDGRPHRRLRGLRARGSRSSAGSCAREYRHRRVGGGAVHLRWRARCRRPVSSVTVTERVDEGGRSSVLVWSRQPALAGHRNRGQNAPWPPS